MSIEEFRDISIIILGIGGTAALILLVVISFLLYFRLKSVLDSMEKTAGTIDKITSSVAPNGTLGQVVSFVQGCRQAVGVVKNLFRKEEERKEEEEEELHG